MNPKKMIAGLVGAVGAFCFIGGSAYEAYLGRISPATPSVATGQVVGMGRGNHFFVTASESNLDECLTAFGFLLWIVAMAIFQRSRKIPKIAPNQSTDPTP